MGKILKTVFALLVFAAGALIFDKVQRKFSDKSWIVVSVKIAVALLLIFVYGFALRWLGNVIG